jgi:prolyl-tRNA synthetase
MRYSKLFGKTFRKIHQNVRSASHTLLLKGGFIRPLGRGLYSFLPLGVRVLDNIKQLIKEEMDGLGGQEVQIPIINPYKIWEKGGRADLIHKELVRFKDRIGKDLVLSPTHEEAAVELVRASINSYRDLPVFIYEFQTKFRDEARTRYGLIRTREFIMKDGYSFHRTYSDLNNFFPKIYAAYERIFKRCNIEVITAEAGVGFIGGDKSYEFLMEAPFGDDVVVCCENCGYRANREVAVGIKETTSGNPKSMAKVYTPDCTNMVRLAEYLELPKSQLAKAMVYRTRNEFVMAVVRGDYEVSTEKLTRALHDQIITKATKQELVDVGLIPGYLSPVGTQVNIKIVIDDMVANSVNLVYGGNEEGVHYTNVNYGRDYETEYIGDIAHIKEENRCKQCGNPLKEVRVVELGNIFKLGEFYTRSMDLSFKDDNDVSTYPNMGSYGIGLGRLMAAIVESNRDDRGIIWPSHLAPYKAFLMGIGKSIAVRRTVEELHNRLPEDVLMDDRGESPGVKFQDADLLGIPIRIVVSSHNLQSGQVEFRDRRSGETWMVQMENVADVVKGWR